MNRAERRRRINDCKLVIETMATMLQEKTLHPFIVVSLDLDNNMHIGSVGVPLNDQEDRELEAFVWGVLQRAADEGEKVI